ncbi:MAG: NAD+ synthase [Dehalococcoidia bacterium]
MRTCRLALAQVNTTIGDFAGNSTLVVESIGRAREAGAAIVALPELAITGYPPEDLILRRSFCHASREAAAAIAAHTEGIIAVVGFVDWVHGDAYNAAAIFADGTWVDTYHKIRLPNYGVFDEQRYFAPGGRVPVFEAGGLTFGVSICEDLWYPGRPLDAMSLAGADLCININASPYQRGRSGDRERMIATRAVDNLIAVAYLNAVGGQDELVFDGASIVFDAEGQLIARAAQFEEELLVVDIDLDQVAQRRLHDPRHRAERVQRGGTLNIDRVRVEYEPSLATPPALQQPVAPLLSPQEEVWRALTLATRDYLHKTGFQSVLIGLSGGVDSAIVAALAVDALGAANVTGVAMPSRYSSEHSLLDARALADSLGIAFRVIPIEPAHAAMLDMLAEAFEGQAIGTAEENLQSRQRGNVLMSLSNATGAMVLATGNKSEMATGYATLYGDMAGGYAVIKDVPKTLVYELSRWRNEKAGRDLIPRSTIEKPPSAELSPDQLDSDSLPPYEVLDPILEAYVEDDRTFDEIVAAGYKPDDVERVLGLVDRNEYKRRQAAPGVKITPRAFGRDRRLPLAARYRGVSR